MRARVVLHLNRISHGDLVTPCACNVSIADCVIDSVIRCQPIAGNNAVLLSIGPSWTNLSGIWIKNAIYNLRKCIWKSHLKMFFHFVKAAKCLCVLTAVIQKMAGKTKSVLSRYSWTVYWIRSALISSNTTCIFINPASKLWGWGYSLIETEWCIYASVIWPPLVQIMACRLAGAKPLSEPVLEYY